MLRTTRQRARSNCSHAHRHGAGILGAMKPVPADRLRDVVDAVLEALDEVASLDEDALAGFGSRHASGLRLYCSTAQHAVLSKDVQSDRLSAFVGLLARHNQDVVIDVPVGVLPCPNRPSHQARPGEIKWDE